MTRRVHDLELASKLRAAAGEGEALIEGDQDRFLVIRVPQAVELDDPADIEMAREAASEYLGARYGADDVLVTLRREVAEDERAR